MVLRDSSEDKQSSSPPITDNGSSTKDNREKKGDDNEASPRDTISPERIPRFVREKSPMQEIILHEQNWKKNIQKIDILLSDACANEEGLFNTHSFVNTFKNENFLSLLFRLFDWESEGEITQEKLVDCVKFTAQKHHGGREWADLIDVVAYVVCGENAKVTEDFFIRIFKSKGVIEKFFKFINKDHDGNLSRKSIMDLIANLTYARPREGFTKENIDVLEKMFRQALGRKDELSFEDFKKICTSKNSFFTERVFEVFDRDKSGSVSLNEFLDAMHQFTGQSSDDKIKFLFRIYDLDGDGLIQREELEEVMKACMEENGMKFSDDQIEDLTVALFEDADTECRGTITYEALKAQLEKHTGLLENLSISIERWLIPPQENVKPRKKKKFSLPYQLTLPYLKNNYVYLSFLFFFLAVNIGLFIDRAITVHNDGGNVYYVLARACGQCLNFNCAFILLLVLRQSLTFMRAHGASDFLPMDQNLYFHKMCGWFIFFYSSLHTVMHFINFSTVIAVQHDEYSAWQWLFTAEPGLFGLVAGWANPTGVILMVILSIMVICSLPFVRKSGCFEVFYFTHLLYIPFWALTILHGPHFWKWFIAPGILFLIEKLYRWLQMREGHGKTFISSGIMLPSKVIHLVVQRSAGFHFCPGDYIYINIPAIAKYEWHPFTISSAPEQDGAIWLHIRSVGEWTNRLYSYFEKQQMYCERSLTKKASASSAASKDLRIMIEDAAQASTTDYINIQEKEAVRKNGIANQAYQKADEDMVVIELDKKSETFQTAPLRKKKIDRTTSEPDFQVKMKKRERNLFLRENFRHPSESNLNTVALKDAQDMVLRGQKLSANQNTLYPSLSSAAQSFRYMRRKPMILTLDMPDESDDDSDSGVLSSANSDDFLNRRPTSPKAAVVRLASAKLFGSRRSTRKSREEKRKSKIELRERRQSRLREAESIGQCTVGKPLVIYMDGPYGAPSSHIFRAQHAVLIGTGIGVTPFASILQSIMHRYLKARQKCPNCFYKWTADIPQDVMNLRKVDFFWINRDQRSFEWFVNLLSQLEIEQAEQGGILDRFLDMHMYITSALQRTDMKAVGLQLALDLLHEKEKRDLITGLKTRTNAGRPNWDKVFKQLSNQKKGKITVFYCGPPALGRTLRYKCGEFGFDFRKEIF